MPHIYSKISITEDWKSCIKQNEVIVVTTKWTDYLDLLQEDLKDKIFLDVRRMFEAKNFKNSIYLTIGLGN